AEEGSGGVDPLCCRRPKGSQERQKLGQKNSKSFARSQPFPAARSEARERGNRTSTQAHSLTHPEPPPNRPCRKFAVALSSPVQLHGVQWRWRVQKSPAAS